ncbi:MAG: OmpH family outer membrane protein [Bryobacteraceae bacterium]|nr:OmpH family outer membrane protein [Bryobacteraceae bacterium]
MRLQGLLVPAIVLSATVVASAQTAPSKVGIINIQAAIVSTADGKKAAAELETRFGPKRKEMEAKQADIRTKQDQLQKGQNTMSEDARQKLMRDIDAATKSFNREAEDAQAELEQEQQKVYNSLGQRMIAVLDKYAKDNGYALILDVSQQPNPVMYAANGIDVTSEVIKLYDANATPGAAAPAAAKPAATPPPPAAKKPAGAK